MEKGQLEAPQLLLETKSKSNILSYDSVKSESAVLSEKGKLRAWSFRFNASYHETAGAIFVHNLHNAASSYGNLTVYCHHTRYRLLNRKRKTVSLIFLRKIEASVKSFIKREIILLIGNN